MNAHTPLTQRWPAGQLALLVHVFMHIPFTQVVPGAQHLAVGPFLVAKTEVGREADIRPCIYCNQGCIGFIELDQPITCTMNPAAGREAEWGEGTLQPARTRKRVLVVGGGPAGLEAARMAALRGHEVTLWERAAEVGGQVNIAAHVRARSAFVQTRTYFEEQCRSLGVKLECEVEATPDRVLAFSPHAVVLATGSVPCRPEFVGAERTLTVWEALETPERLGENVVVIEADGHMPSVAVAEQLADLGKRVTVVTSRGTIGWRVNSYSMLATRHRFREKRIKILPLRAVRAYDAERLILEDLSVGDEDMIEDVTGVVAAYGGTACDELYEPLRGQVSELRMIGDAVAPRTALDAIYEGHSVGRSL